MTEKYRYNAEIEKAIVDWVKDILNYDTVIAEQQKTKAPKPTGEFASFLLGASIKLGCDDVQYKSGAFTAIGLRKMPLSITIYADNALEDAAELRNSLELPYVLDTLRTAGVHICKALDIKDTSAILETGFEPRATLDIEIYVTESITDNVTTYIETVELEYEEPT
jgi:hypothetical protein